MGLKGWWHGAAPTMEVPRAAQTRACWVVLSAMHCPGSEPPCTSQVCSSQPLRKDNKNCLELRSSKFKDSPGASQLSLSGFPKAPKNSSGEAKTEEKGGCHSISATATQKRQLERLSPSTLASACGLHDTVDLGNIAALPAI